MSELTHILLSAEILERLRQAGLSSASIAPITRYGDDRLRYVLDELERQYRAGEEILDPANWLADTLAEEWPAAGGPRDKQLTLQDALVAASRPPEGTNGVRLKATGLEFEVLALHDDRVEIRDPRLSGAIARGVILDADWPGCEWLSLATEAFARPEASAPEPADTPELRALRGVAMWAACHKPSASALAERLDARGLTLATWQAYQAAYGAPEPGNDQGVS